MSALFSLTSFLFLVPSPRWLTLQGHPSEAAAAWDKLQVQEEDRQKVETEYIGEIDEQNSQSSENSITVASDQEKAGPGGPHHQNHSQGKMFDLFSADVRARTFLAVFIMGMQQLSGIDGVLYVSKSTLFVFSFGLRSSMGYDSFLDGMRLNCSSWSPQHLLPVYP